MELVRATIRLYQNALKGAVRSFLQSWVLVIAMILFAVLLALVTTVALRLGMLGGFLLGFANAFVVGWTLSLLEQAIKGTRRLWWPDIWGSAGNYFWDVITIGFIIWVPLQVLELGMQTNPYGPAIVSAVFLLLFILLNPIPEVLYQGRHTSSLDAFKESYEFVMENWVEWFLPMAIVLAPLGLTFFFSISGQGGRLIGLDFFQLLQIPAAVLSMWFQYLGVPSAMITLLSFVFTPVATVFIMLFRGHLYAALSGTSRRQRLFQMKSSGGS